jgi:hypothetical protein
MMVDLYWDETTFNSERSERVDWFLKSLDFFLTSVILRSKGIGNQTGCSIL